MLLYFSFFSFFFFSSRRRHTRYWRDWSSTCALPIYFDYYKTEITFVNWVRDRQFAQVHVLVTAQQTGGGQEYTLTFIGLERFAGAEDTLHYLSHAADTQDDLRKGLGQVLRLRLVRVAGRTPVAP